MFRFIRKFYYKCIIENKVMAFRYYSLFQILEKYDKFNKKVGDGNTAFGNGDIVITNEDEVVAYKTECNAGTVYDLFYEHMHIQLVDGSDKIIKIVLKEPDEKWKMFYDPDTQRPTTTIVRNKTMEAYLWYDIEVLGDRRCENTIYSHGPWDEYVYKTLNKIGERVNSFTIYSEFSNSYTDLLFSKKDRTFVAEKAEY